MFSCARRGDSLCGLWTTKYSLHKSQTACSWWSVYYPSSNCLLLSIRTLGIVTYIIDHSSLFMYRKSLQFLQVCWAHTAPVHTRWKKCRCLQLLSSLCSVLRGKPRRCKTFLTHLPTDLLSGKLLASVMRTWVHVPARCGQQVRDMGLV